MVTTAQLERLDTTHNIDEKLDRTVFHGDYRGYSIILDKPAIPFRGAQSSLEQLVSLALQKVKKTADTNLRRFARLNLLDSHLKPHSRSHVKDNRLYFLCTDHFATTFKRHFPKSQIRLEE